MTIASRFVREMLPGDQTSYGESLVADLDRFAPGLTPVYLEATAGIVHHGYDPVVDTLAEGALQDLAGFEPIVDAAVVELRPTEQDHAKSARERLAFLNGVYNDGYAEHMADNGDGHMAENSHAGLVNGRPVSQYALRLRRLRRRRIDGHIDLLIGATEALDPEVRVQTLLKTNMVAVASDTHPIFSDAITPERFATFDQISVSRRGRMNGPIDTALAVFDLRRRVVLTVPTFSAAFLMLANGDLILPIADLYVAKERSMLAGLRAFPIPLDLPPVTLRLAWHPRLEADAAHQWLRDIVREISG